MSSLPVDSMRWLPRNSRAFCHNARDLESQSLFIRPIVLVPIDIVKSPKKTCERDSSFSTYLFDSFVTVTPNMNVKAIKHPPGARNCSQQTSECGVRIDLHCVRRTGVCQADRNSAETIRQ